MPSFTCFYLGLAYVFKKPHTHTCKSKGTLTLASVKRKEKHTQGIPTDYAYIFFFYCLYKAKNNMLIHFSTVQYTCNVFLGHI